MDYLEVTKNESLRKYEENVRYYDLFHRYIYSEQFSQTNQKMKTIKN
jgi:hypothetical protein